MSMTTPIFASNLKMAAKDISRQVTEKIKSEREVTNPQVEILLGMIQPRFGRLDC